MLITVKFDINLWKLKSQFFSLAPGQMRTREDGDGGGYRRGGGGG